MTDSNRRRNEHQFTLNTTNYPDLHLALNNIRNNPELRLNAIVAPILQEALRKARPELFKIAVPAAPASKPSLARKLT